MSYQFNKDREKTLSGLIEYITENMYANDFCYNDPLKEEVAQLIRDLNKRLNFYKSLPPQNKSFMDSEINKISYKNDD